MRSPTCGQAGSMPEATLARGPLALDEEFLADVEISDFQREVGRRLLRIAERLPAGCYSARAAIGRHIWPGGSSLLVNFVPRNKACAEMTIYIDRDLSIHIGAGSETTFGLPNDVWDQRARDAPAFMERIVESVVAGKLRETIQRRGDTTVRCKSELDVDGVRILVDRTDVGSAFRAIFRKRTRREVVYPPYS